MTSLARAPAHSAHRVNGQIGAVLAAELRATYGAANVVCSDIAEPSAATLAAGPFERLNVLDADALREVLRHGITTVYHLSAVLSARGEADPARTWDVNTRGLLHVLDAARDGLIRQVFFPPPLPCSAPTCRKTPRRMMRFSTPPPCMA